MAFNPRATLRHGMALLVLTVFHWGPLGSTAAYSQAITRQDPNTFPPTQLFRDLQLVTITCGRENTPKSCDRARATADPLLDHPKLPASCKDTLWNIRQRATVARKNTYERRETLNRDATDVIALCKPAAKPLGSGTQPSAEEGKKSGGLGGFLRGLSGGGGDQQSR